jgi:GNAT superfamily N-acetyltransferase
VIRPAASDDVPKIFALVRELARYERLEEQVTGTAGDLHEHLFGQRRYAEALVADDAGSVAGFALFFHNYSTFLARPGIYLEDLFVRPEYRRRGHGRALLRAIARIALDRGCGRFEWTVLDWNDSAVAFYRSLGAAPMPDWRICRLAGNGLVQLAEAQENPSAKRESG